MATKKTKELHEELANSNSTEGMKTQDQTGPSFVHLHVLSAFSLLESALPVQTLLNLADKDQQPALAITDRNNLFGALEFSEKAVKQGIQPIMGCKLAVNFEDDLENKPKSGFLEHPFLPFLAMNDTGFANLKKTCQQRPCGYTRWRFSSCDNNQNKGAK